MEAASKKVLFIDNFDSFTYNLVDDFAKRQCQTRVYRADTSIEDLKAVADEFDPDLLVISPGPGNPDTAGVSLEAVDYFKDKLPIFGVCLGHQTIVQYFGGVVGHAPEPMHGKPSRITHNEQGTLPGIENPLQAGRYHSLTARTPAGLPGRHRRVRGHRHGRPAQGTAHLRRAVPSREHPDARGRQDHPERSSNRSQSKTNGRELNMANITQYLEIILNGKDLTFEQAKALQDTIFEGQVTEVQIAAFLAMMRMKRATSGEIAGLAQSLRDHAVRVQVDFEHLIDTCGTGGAVVKTFNISTASAFVAAGAGAYVAKHGNRGITSRCGSADVLDELGVNIDPGPEVVAECIREAHIGFMFAPKFHPAMRFVQPIRKSLDFRTAFNILGPLANPAGVKAQVMGVSDAELLDRIAESLKMLGTKRAMVVHGQGMDEISLLGKTRIVELRDGKITSFELDPTDYGIANASIDALGSGDAIANAARHSRDPGRQGERPPARYRRAQRRRGDRRGGPGGRLRAGDSPGRSFN